MRPTGIIARISHTRVLSPQGPADVSLCSVLSALWFYIYTEVYGWFRVHFAPSVGLGQGPFLTRLFSYSSSFAEKDHPFSTWPPLGRSGAPAVCLCIQPCLHPALCHQSTALPVRIALPTLLHSES